MGYELLYPTPYAREGRYPLAVVLVLLALVSLYGCEQDIREGSFYEDVKAAYEDCDDAEIRFLTQKHGIQTAFARCGSNNFLTFDWAPNGVHLYFQLPPGGYILDGEKKTISVVPTALPKTNGVWLDDNRICFLLPVEDQDDIYDLTVYDRSTNSLTAVRTTLREPRYLQGTGQPTRLLVTALDQSSRRRPFSLKTTDGRVERAFTWLGDELDTFTFEPATGFVTWANANESHLALQDGSHQVDFPDSTRAVVHHGGRYVALERLGDSVSPFDQSGWDELSDEARERRKKKRDAWVERLPEWAPREVRPPSFDIYDLENNSRYRITSFQGSDFHWYPARDYYCYFRLWGVEGVELHKNVGLVDLTDRLRVVGRGEFPRGMELVSGQLHEGTL